MGIGTGKATRVLYAALVTATVGFAPGAVATAACIDSHASAARGFEGAREPAAMGHGDEVPEGSRRRPKAFAVTIPVYFHVISAGPSAEEGNVPLTQVHAQVKVLNRAFAGGYGGAATPFSFKLVEVTRTENPRWFSMGYQSREERQAKSALRRGGADALNIYSTDGAGHTLLGWATWPSSYRGQPLLDGIVVHYGSLPGGWIDGFDLGQTATHEAGHWVGLFHTFQNGCSATGDHVDDTPAQRVPTGGCPEGKDTCAAPGLDPIHNFMDYSDDACYSEFTPGQADRATEQFVHYRSG